MAVISDEARIRELAEAIRVKCTTVRPGASTPTTTNSVQPQQHNEVRRKLKEVVMRLQEDVRDSSLTGVQTRVQYTAQKHGLTYSTQKSTTHNNIMACYISSESFYIEISIEDSGHIVSTSLVLGQETKDTEVLLSLLRKQDYPMFESHLCALVDLFNQGTGSGQDKARILLQVTSAIEQVFLSIDDSGPQRSIYDTIKLNHLGYVTPRKAGLPMQLTFFATPAELLKEPSYDTVSKEKITLSSSFGTKCNIVVERTTQMCRLPIDPNLFNRSSSSFNPITEQNTLAVPLTLVLSLCTDIPVCAYTLSKLQHTVHGGDATMPQLSTPHINNLIMMESNVKDKDSKRQIIYLPGQVHYYHGIKMEDGKDTPPADRGIMLPGKKVSFTHPIHSINIIHYLRQQLVYNTLIKSCLTRSTNLPKEIPSDFSDYTFNITTKPPNLIAMATNLLGGNGDTVKLLFEFRIPAELTTSPTQPTVCVGVNGVQEAVGKASEILVRCLSIPVTLYACFSRPASILPQAACDVILSHQEAIRRFHHELVSCDQSCELARAPAAVAVSETTFVGMKRKRTD